MRILLLGRNGQVGWELQRALAPLGDRRADGLLASAYRALNEQADRLAEHVPRDEFMRSTMAARSLCAAWAAAQAGGANPGPAPAEP